VKLTYHIHLVPKLLFRTDWRIGVLFATGKAFSLRRCCVQTGKRARAVLFLMVTRDSSLGVKLPELTTELHLVFRLKMHGPLPSFRHTSSWYGA
jgi:hypothetical protein